MATDRSSGTDSRTSVVEVLSSPANKNSFSFFNQSKDSSDSVSSERSVSWASTPESKDSLVQLLAVEHFTKNKIKRLAFCDKLDMLSVGMQSGTIINYLVEIETLGFYDAEEEEKKKKTKAASTPKNKKIVPTSSRTLASEGNELARQTYQQSEDDLPQLDVEQGEWTTKSTTDEKAKEEERKSLGNGDDELDDFYA